MTLVLRLLGPPRLMGARPRCELGQGSLSVGRSPEADWVIPDTERLISRVHLRIDASHGGFVLTDTSVNGVYVNGSPEAVGYGASVQLRDGDALRIGEAQIAVEIQGGDAAPPPSPAFALDVEAFAAELRRNGPAPEAAPARDLPRDLPRELPRDLPRDPLGGPFGGPSGAAPAAPPRTVIDANWMNPPEASARPLPEPAGLRQPAHAESVVPLRPGRAGLPEDPPGGPASLAALVEARPGLSARRLAAAIDAAGQDLDPATWQALHKRVRSFLETGTD